MPVELKFKSQTKSQAMRKKHHLECVICGDNFGSFYDELLKSFPNFHSKEHKPDKDCYDQYYSILFRIYQYLMEHETSVSIKQFMDEFDWCFVIHQKKLLLMWSMVNGFLQVDDFKRLVVPEVVVSGMELLEDQLAMPHYLDMYLRRFKDQLPGVEPDKMPFQAEDAGKNRRPLSA